MVSQFYLTWDSTMEEEDPKGGEGANREADLEEMYRWWQ